MKERRMLIRWSVAGAALALVALAGGRALTGQAGPDGPPYSPEQSMSMIRLEPGFRVELVASEPDVQSPVAMDIDEDGRIAGSEGRAAREEFPTTEQPADKSATAATAERTGPLTLTASAKGKGRRSAVSPNPYPFSTERPGSPRSEAAATAKSSPA
jgi:hypothetical protein